MTNIEQIRAGKYIMDLLARNLIVLYQIDIDAS